MALNIAPATGQQTTTQNPQTVPNQTLDGNSAKSGGVQPGTALDLLNNTQGENLGTASLTTVSINPNQVQAGKQAASAEPAVKPHHTDAALFIVPVVLCVAAVAMFWAMSRSAKSTTN